jgi:transcriptional regulator with XRE-family HTH domain
MANKYGERLRFYRKQRNLSQAEMAEHLNMAPATYSKLETNRTQLSAVILDKIASLFEVSPMSILRDTATAFYSLDVRQPNSEIMLSRIENIEKMLASISCDLADLRRLMADMAYK